MSHLKNIPYLTPAFLLIFFYLLFDFHLFGLTSSSPEIIFHTTLFLGALFIPIFFALELFIKDKPLSGAALYLLALILFTSSEYFKTILNSVVLLILAWGTTLYIIKKRLILLQECLWIASIVPIMAFLAVLSRTSQSYADTDWSRYIVSLSERKESPILPAPNRAALPDIYYIVLDGYGRQDTIKEYYGYDNSPFIEELQNEGFIIPADIHANYARTVTSITSTLNMDYIPGVIDGVEDSKFWWLAKPFLERNRVRTSLERIGYKSITIATDWDITNNQTSDLYLKPQPVHLTDYEGYLFEKSMLRFIHPWIGQYVFLPAIDSHRYLIEFSFEKIWDIAEDPEPTFVFAHIVAPHPPFVFDKDGNYISPQYDFTFHDANDFPGTGEDYRKGYTGQIQHINHLIETTVDAILKHSETPPIIILQGDHGPGMLTDYTSAENTCLKERFSIFAAYYLPGFNQDSFPKNFTPVNLFRLIFNEYFSTDLPLLHNSSYFEKRMLYVYDTMDITDGLKSGQGDACKILSPFSRSFPAKPISIAERYHQNLRYKIK